MGNDTGYKFRHLRENSLRKAMRNAVDKGGQNQPNTERGPSPLTAIDVGLQQRYEEAIAAYVKRTSCNLWSVFWENFTAQAAQPPGVGE